MKLFLNSKSSYFGPPLPFRPAFFEPSNPTFKACCQEGTELILAALKNDLTSHFCH